MTGLSAHDTLVFLLSLGVLLFVARAMGEAARRLSQPVVLGELLAGICLGPTVLGRIAPHSVEFLFPSTGNVPAALHALTTLAVTLFLLVAGIEVDLSTVWRQGRASMVVSFSGIIVPFTVGAAAAWLAPDFLGRHTGADALVFTLFFATAMAISALPVIAKTLMDLNLYRTDLGMLVIAAAVFNDVAGWLVFAVVLGLMGKVAEHGGAVGWTLGLTLLFAAGTLTVFRWLVNRVLPWIQAHTSWPGGVLGFALSLALFGAAAAEWIGVHAIFGSFLVGVAIGDSRHLREQTRTTINQFVSFIFAPLFFAAIGLRLDFAARFDPVLTLLVLVVACVGKVLGCTAGARLGGLPRREAWAVGFAMNARGAMEIILGLLALRAGVIDERMFVTLVVVAILTSMVSGPAMKSILRLRRERKLSDFLVGKAFIPRLVSGLRGGVIRELIEALAESGTVDRAATERAVLAREALQPTGVGNRIALPHARVTGLERPLVALGVSHDGVDFDAPDGETAQLIFLILTPQHDDGAQVTILAEIARTFAREETRHAALAAQTYTELLAVLRAQSA